MKRSVRVAVARASSEEGEPDWKDAGLHGASFEGKLTPNHG